MIDAATAWGRNGSVKKERPAKRRRAADLRALGLEEGVHGVVRGRRAVAPHGVLLAVAGQVRPVRVAAGGVHPTETCPPDPCP